LGSPPGPGGVTITRRSTPATLDGTAFISDNGGPTMKGVTVNGSVNTPLRGSKRTTLEGGIRVPFLLAWPGRIQPGVYAQPVIQLDLHATALSAAGIPADPAWKLEGANLLPLLSGAANGVSGPALPHDALFWRFGQQMAVRRGDWKLVRYDSNADTQSGKSEPVTAPRLYNLASDIHEDHDLSAAQPDKVRELQSLWDAWNRANIRPLWGNRGGDSDGAEPGAPARRGRRKAANGVVPGKPAQP
jgi:arylsulfatase A-like enzyme